MTRDEAIERVRKLRAVTTDHGATPAEAEVAERKAKSLIAKFDLRHGDLAERPLLPPEPSPVGGVVFHNCWFFPDGPGNATQTTTSQTTGNIWILFA